MNEDSLSPQDRQLLDAYQHRFPLVPEPFKAMAAQLGIAESELLARLKLFQDLGVISRVGAVFKPRRIGASTLAAMSVPDEDVARVAAFINTFSEVNHNYEREHAINLWFVVTAADEARLTEVVTSMEQRTGLPVHTMPLVEEYYIDLGFPLHG